MASAQSAPSPLIPWIGGFARTRDWLRKSIEPLDAVTGAQARRRARYTALCIAILLPLGLLALALSLTVAPIQERLHLTQLRVMTGALIVLALLLPLSRGRSYATAAYAVIIVTCAAVWVPAWRAYDVGVPQTMLFFLALPVLISGLLLSPLGAAIVSAGNVSAAFAMVPILNATGRTSLGEALTAPFFLFVVAGFVVNSARLRERDLAEVERLADELRDQQRTRVQMLNNIAHDLGSPLTPLKLQLALMREDTPVSAPRVAILRRNIGQLERLVADVKDLARLDSGGFRIEKAPADLADVSRAAVDGFGADAAARGVELRAELDGQLPVTVDVQRMTQVLYNLVTNALKFTPSGGRVTVRGSARGGEVFLSVEDTGRGLSRDEMSRLFRPFSQVHEPGEVKERGTGLGLYISRGIVEAHGGRLVVASEGPGRGSTFTISLPAR